MAIQIRKAARQKAKLRVGLSGPSGSGKTLSALLIAKGITQGRLDKVTLIDTENGSGDLYSHIGEYNIIPIEAPYTPEKYVEAIQACEKAGMEVVIIDSVSHEWDGKGGLLEANELLGQTKFKGNNWAAWSVTTPRHQKFIESITSAKMHVITTARSKTDTIQTEDKKIKKVGLKEIQREGFEYELTLNFNIDRDKHYAVASKDRTGIFSEMDPFIIDETTGHKLLEWSESGVEPTAPPVVVNKKQIEEEESQKKEKEVIAQKQDIRNKLQKLGFAPTSVEDFAVVVKLKTSLDLSPENYGEIQSRLAMLVEEVKGK